MTQGFQKHLLQNESECVDTLLEYLDWQDDQSARVSERAAELVKGMRAAPRESGQMESYLQEFGLSTKEGQAIMGLAEALLRIPDAATANLLIADKLSRIDWTNERTSRDIVLLASRLGIALSRNTLASVFGRLGQPVIRAAMKRAMRMMGGQFVLGRTPEEAVKNARAYVKKDYRMSYDMLGEAARTREDAERYFNSYVHAVATIGRTAPEPVNRPTLSVKLSALHPRYAYAQADKCVPELSEKLLHICRRAAEQNIGVTVDAEESDRLSMSMDIIEAVISNKSLVGWDRFGMALQAYQKRALHVIDHLVHLSENYNRFIDVRLVKGAYWDTEIKRAQVMGLDNYPVFTRKANTDLSYLACARKLLDSRDYLYPMFATHNAHTVAAVIDLAGQDKTRMEFQRLHGMGEALHNLIMERFKLPSSVYAPVGLHEDLLPYLVRRLLENGASTSFVFKQFDDSLAPEELARDPVSDAQNHAERKHRQIPLPKRIYGYERDNAAGMELTDALSVDALYAQMDHASPLQEAAPLIAGKTYKDGVPDSVHNPAEWRTEIGKVWNADQKHIDLAFEKSREAFPVWNRTPAAERAEKLERYADLLEEHTAELIKLCILESGKTVPDALAEIREALDFCRYYAVEGRKLFKKRGTELIGPTGELNAYALEGRGCFVCISPWNFPLAIFTGQIVAALMAGNAVIAKPAEQTPLIAMTAVRLMHKAGIPKDVIQLLPGDGQIGADLVEYRDVAGVAFTGSIEAAKSINRALAEKEGPIAPLIAETGGLNAMIVDSSALTEQVVDDVIHSAFGSAGQRCSALRILMLQEEIADRTMHMLKGAMREICVGDPYELSTDVGPVIDEKAHAGLVKHFRNLEGFGRLIARANLPEELENKGHYFAPCAWELKDIDMIDREIFGPVLHVVRFARCDLDGMIDALNGKGYGLTFGMHSRIESEWRRVLSRVHAGNCYVNRGMTGAVVGVQPFGGHGLSGTGPKAGGPNTLQRFAIERSVSVNTTASGGNASLVSLEE